MAFTREQILEKVKGLKAHAEGAARIGSSAEAEAFAQMVNELLLKHEISEAELDIATREKNEPIVQVLVQQSAFGIERKKTRVEWQERLAGTIARAHMCRILISGHSNHIWFVGTETNATVAEYVYGTLVPLVSSMSKRAEVDYWKATGMGRGADNQAKGYRNSWINGFLSRIYERLEAARKAAVRDANDHGVSSATALVRLDNSLMRVEDYLNKLRAADDLKKLKHVKGRGTNNFDGYHDGRAAADRVQLNKGVGGHRDTTRKLS